MRKTFQYRLFPSNPQRATLQRQLDACRWVYNETLETRKSAWEERQESLSRYDTNKLLTAWRAEHEFLANGHAQAMQEAQKRVDLAFRAFFRRVKAGEKPGFPRFRSFDRYDSFTYPQEKGNWRFLDNHCPQCGLILDRDHNAALNILARGLAGMGNQSLEAPPFEGGE